MDEVGVSDLPDSTARAKMIRLMAVMTLFAAGIAVDSCGMVNSLPGVRVKFQEAAQLRGRLFGTTIERRRVHGAGLRCMQWLRTKQKPGRWPRDAPQTISRSRQNRLLSVPFGVRMRPASVI